MAKPWSERQRPHLWGDGVDRAGLAALGEQLDRELVAQTKTHMVMQLEALLEAGYRWPATQTAAAAKIRYEMYWAVTGAWPPAVMAAATLAWARHDTPWMPTTGQLNAAGGPSFALLRAEREAVTHIMAALDAAGDPGEDVYDPRAAMAGVPLRRAP